MTSFWDRYVAAQELGFVIEQGQYRRVTAMRDDGGSNQAVVVHAVRPASQAEEELFRHWLANHEFPEAIADRDLHRTTLINLINEVTAQIAAATREDNGIDPVELQRHLDDARRAVQLTRQETPS